MLPLFPLSFLSRSRIRDKLRRESRVFLADSGFPFSHAELWKSDIHRPSVDIRLPQDYYNDSADELDELWLDDNSEEELASDGD